MPALPIFQFSIFNFQFSFTLPSHRNAAQQILQVLVAPADSAAEDEGRVVEGVVDAGAEEELRRVRLLVAEDVFAEEAQVRQVVALLAEIEGLAGDAQAIAELVVGADAAGGVEETDAQRQIVEDPARLRGSSASSML